MEEFKVLGKDVQRKEGPLKVTGKAKYTNDYDENKVLYIWLVTSVYAHAKIKAINVKDALKAAGVRAILTGEDFTRLVGSVIEDRPIIAFDRVRYYGEPVAVVVADSEYEAKRAAELIKVEYVPLPVVNSPNDAMKSNAPILHEKLSEYKVVEPRAVFPEKNTNIANRTKIRKGDMKKGWMESEVVTEEKFSFPPSDHISMETRCSTAEILPDGTVKIYSTSQAAYTIKEYISLYFNVELEKVIVTVPLVGGAYGGKTPVQLELIAYLASKAVGGRKVKINNSRETDMVTSPVHIGLDAIVKLGCTKKAKITAAEITFMFDGGAYSDRAAIISRAAAVDCTGPYNIENVKCDSICMYTNHTYATAFRGFGHSELTFVIERTMDVLSKKINMDPLEFRLKNAIIPGDITPTHTMLNRSNIGNLPKCIEKLSQLVNWNGEERIDLGNNKVRARGISCFWKNSNTPTNAGSGAILTFNRDGSININVGAAELGQGTKTALAQILAEKMKMDVNKIQVFLEVNTQITPEHWKTAASRSILMAGRAILEAADDVINQLFNTASIVLRASSEELEIGGGRVFLKETPQIGVDIKDIAFGYTYPNGNSIGGQVIGRGSYIMKHLTEMNPETGAGNPGPEWTVGAAMVEVEFDTKELTYKFLNAATIIDAGKVINNRMARGQITGGMSMGLSFASREAFLYTDKGVVRNATLRLYKVMEFGEPPNYIVGFIETPHLEGPYGARGIGEYGVIGMPAALANSLSIAAEVPLNELPLIPELIWRAKGGKV